MHHLLDRLCREELSILIVHGDKELYRSALPGVRPLLDIWLRFPEGLTGATIADRVVGGCAARIFAHLKAARVLALTGSVSARAILAAAGIGFEVKHGVLAIRNRNGTDTCPFEQLSRHYLRAEELVPAIHTRLDQLRPAR
ncbi:MAG TPA: DUF1893 domain-containing protein [candidate division WOR-3 bacterium]|uniref:DUF1893 domain-containing protein n=1 Tax=candidate division WOR-3 bacterium TaxID=2052148 RepID=A0A7V0T4H7_UNCW3|nr:DUF1893 domain-containing protein [candidate division WOR-3 bacterium]